MKLSILYDNHAVQNFQSGWGFSCLVDDRILFDTGEAPEPLLANMARLGVEPKQIEAVVISHDHWDHTGGLWQLLEINHGLIVYACPGFSEEFKRKVTDLQGKLILCPSGRDLDETISITGEILGQYKKTPIAEQSLMVKTDKGLVVITGCSHPGVTVILEKAREQYPDLLVDMILGGFHFKDMDDSMLEQSVSALYQFEGLRVGPTHCTGEKAADRIREHFGGRFVDVAAGVVLEIPKYK